MGREDEVLLLSGWTAEGGRPYANNKKAGRVSSPRFQLETRNSKLETAFRYSNSAKSPRCRSSSAKITIAVEDVGVTLNTTISPTERRG